VRKSVPSPPILGVKKESQLLKKGYKKPLTPGLEENGKF
jgi:hypothetical protein